MLCALGEDDDVRHEALVGSLVLAVLRSNGLCQGHTVLADQWSQFLSKALTVIL